MWTEKPEKFPKVTQPDPGQNPPVFGLIPLQLELTENKLNGEHLKELGTLKSLQSLTLGANEIYSYEELECLKDLPELFQLELSGCPVSGKEDYREKVYSMFKNLEVK